MFNNPQRERIYNRYFFQVIKTRQIDIKNQYGLERKVFHHKQFEVGDSLQKAQYNQTQNKYNSKPLQGGVQTQISFKGFKLSAIQNFSQTTISPIPEKLTQKVFDSLKRISKEQYSNYDDIRKKYVQLIKTNKNVRKSLGIPEKIVEQISEDNL